MTKYTVDSMFLNNVKEQHDSVNYLKKNILLEGCCLINKNDLSLTVDQWKTLNYEVSKLKYETFKLENVNERSDIKISKIKMPQNMEIKNKAIFDVMNSVQVRNFVMEITGVSHFTVDQCVCYVYEGKNFIPTHQANNNSNVSQYAIHFFLDGNYTEGQHMIYQSKERKCVHTPNSGEILLVSCDYIHEVQPITSGTKSLILALIQPC